jgi:hypothetical protein
MRRLACGRAGIWWPLWLAICFACKQRHSGDSSALKGYSSTCWRMWFACKHAGGPAVCTAISGRLAIVERSFVRSSGRHGLGRGGRLVEFAHREEGGALNSRRKQLGVQSPCRCGRGAPSCGERDMCCGSALDAHIGVLLLSAGLVFMIMMPSIDMSPETAPNPRAPKSQVDPISRAPRGP